MSDPVFVTGASGFIARHVLLDLLRRGYRLRGSVRSLDRGEHVRASLSRHLGEELGPDRLDFRQLDLGSDAGWTQTMEGCGALIHMASPVPLAQPEDADDLIRPAREGTLRALNAARASGIRRVVLTSSVAAISGNATKAREIHLDEGDWTDPATPGLTPYARSKTIAERAAWELAEAHPELRLTTINPSFVFGPALDEDTGASLEVVERMMRGGDPAIPRVSFFVVDVRDVAALHVAALEDDRTAGQRIIAGSGQMWLRDIVAVLRAAYPDRRFPRWPAPDWLVRLLALKDRPLRFIVPQLGRKTLFDTGRGRALLGRDFIPPEDAVRAAAASLVEHGRI